MSRKIIGITVGTQLPKPDFKQTDPTKGDYIKNKPDFEDLKSQVNNVSDLVGDTAVSEQINTAVSTKADASHTHTIANVTNLQSSLDAKVPTSRTINGKDLSENITLSASDVNAYSKTEIDVMEFITVDDIDAICGTTISLASEELF